MNEGSVVCVLYTVHLGVILHLNKAGMLAIVDFVDMCDERACEVWFVCYIHCSLLCLDA